MRTNEFIPLWLNIDSDGSFELVEAPHDDDSDRGAQND